MKVFGRYEIKPGEIWAVAGADAAARSAWCASLARDEEIAERTAILNFSQQADEAGKTGWPQARYYAEEGRSVAEYLSFNTVYEVNKFEVGARYPETRTAYRKRLDSIMRLLDLQGLKNRPAISLSNGEIRRMLLARALSKNPDLLVLDDPAGGLDSRQRLKLKDIVSALAGRGQSVIFAYRHTDELPPGVTRWLKIGRDGQARTAAAPKVKRGQPIKRAAAVRRKTAASSAIPVVEIRNLDIPLAGRHLFNGLSWTVRKGERWVLRGENGSGKTTLFALVTGDSPLAYAVDVKVFGVPRDTGTELARVRRRIGVASPEMQAYLGLSPEELLSHALRAKYDLLLLDEPFMNMDATAARRAARRIERFLNAHPAVAAILVCHRRDEAPRIFDREINLDDRLNPLG